MPGSVVVGPVVRGDDRAYGEQVTLDGARSFVLVLRGPEGGWRVHRVDTAERGDDLVTWLRAAGWRPTGEEGS
jgi:hypothetical protein